MKHLTSWVLLSAVLAVNFAAGQDVHTYGDRLGKVALPADCSEAAAPHLERGLSLLHHMTYDASAAAFAAAAEADPQCAMGYWGQALSYIHPLWSDPPTEERFTKGVDMLEKTGRIEQLTDRERAYIAAVGAYYEKGWNRNESANLAAFEKAWESVHREYPDDREAAAVYALSMIATADPADKTYANQKRAGALAERVLAQHPDHPGAHHYIIHAYDVPALSDRALDVARRYGDLAPAVPHALHMPSHIFTRQGLWEESIAWNRRSAEAAQDHPVGTRSRCIICMRWTILRTPIFREERTERPTTCCR